MIWRTVVASLVVSCAVLGVPERTARANGRLPATSTITFRHGHETDIAVGLTFGLILSHDGGQTWTWMCEAAVGYGGMYDPFYAYTSSGALFATTFGGLKVMRDGCTFAPTPEGKSFVSTSTIGPDGTLWYAAAQTADPMNHIDPDFKIYNSLDDGMTLPTGLTVANPTDTNVWWQSIMVAPNNTNTVYLSGYRYLPNPSGSGTIRDHLLFRSDNGGASWNALAKTGLTLMPNSIIHLVGIASDDPAHLYARVELVDNTQSDALYVSTNSGVSWTEIHRKATTIGAFAVRAAKNAQGKHDLVAGTVALGAEVSHDDGMNWTALTSAPHMGCLVENTAGELWACTQNYGVAPAPSDDAGIMKTTDLATWTKVLRYQDLTNAASCGADTLQQAMCAPTWCAVCAQLSCTPAASYACPVPQEAPMTKAGCCDTGSGPGGPLALALSVATVLLRPNRRRDS
ncbi:MAG TPA: hypothetical protein VF469_25145 [Kofleriaceae bacterium]